MKASGGCSLTKYLLSTQHVCTPSATHPLLTRERLLRGAQGNISNHAKEKKTSEAPRKNLRRDWALIVRREFGPRPRA